MGGTFLYGIPTEARDTEDMEPLILPIGAHYKYGQNIYRLPATRISVERKASERSRATIDLAYDDLGGWLSWTPTLLAAVAAGAGNLIPVPPVYPDGGGFPLHAEGEVLYGISLGEYAPYDMETERWGVRIVGVGPEVYSGLWSGGDEFEKGTKVKDVLQRLAEREEDGKERWEFRAHAIPDSYVLPYNYPMAGRSAVEAIQDLCRSYGLAYELRRHRGRTVLIVWGPAAAPVTSMDPWPKAGYRDGYPPAYIRITPAIDPLGMMDAATRRAGASGVPRDLWKKVLAGEGRRDTKTVLGQAEAPVTALDGLPLLARVGLAAEDKRYSGLLGQIEAIISGAIRGIREHWTEVKQLLLGVDHTTRVLEVAPLDWPKLRFEPPEGDLLAPAKTMGSDQLQYDYSPPLTVEEAIRILKSTPGVKIEDKGGTVVIRLPNGTTTEVGKNEVVYLVRDPKTRSPISLLIQGTMGQGDLANYYPFQLEVTLPATPFYSPWHAVQLKGWGGFLNGWWRILSVAWEYGDGRWTATLVLGRKDFPWG